MNRMLIEGRDIKVIPSVLKKILFLFNFIFIVCINNPCLVVRCSQTPEIRQVLDFYSLFRGCVFGTIYRCESVNEQFFLQ